MKNSGKIAKKLYLFNTKPQMGKPFTKYFTF
jgi:hypothetical protein